MRRSALLPMLGAAMLIVVSIVNAQAPPEVTLTRLDCGADPAPADIARFSDTYAHDGRKLQRTFSCYLIKHGSDYLVWDAGYPPAGMPDAGPTSPKRSLVEQLAQLNLKPEQVKYIALSHYHGDHIGQVTSFARSTLLIGKGDWDVIANPRQTVVPNAAARFEPWLEGGSQVEPVPVDKDVFGDGTVVMLNMPGHTPGHHSLLVKLKSIGNVLISGDVAHFRENYDTNGVPSFNTDRADTLASLDRFKQIAANLKASVIIQHDTRDISKLPAFPGSAQ